MHGRRLRRLGTGALALVLLAACGPSLAPTAPGASPSSKPPAQSATPSTAPSSAPPTSPVLTPPVVATLAPITPGLQSVLSGRVSGPRSLVLAAGSGISDQGSGIISDNGGGLVSNNGGNIISDKGAGVVANNGARYRLRADDDVSLGGVPVTLVDGAGAPVFGPDGKAVVSVTDASGRYAFAGVRPAQHLVVQATLPQVGALSRIVAPDVADAPLDVASTLASAYILGKYVATQADRQATLNRLPAAVEAETVLIAGQAAAADAPPLSLATSELVTRVDALRMKAPTLDAQLEKVKQLLIVAGVSNLGDGLPGTEVALGQIRALAIDGLGRVYLNDWGNKTLWRLDADGKLRAIAGRPLADARAATLGEAAIAKDGWPDNLTIDAQGRLLLLGGSNVVRRLSPDGSIERLAAGDLLATAATTLPDGSVLAFGRNQAQEGDPWQVRKLVAGSAPVALPGFKADFGFNLANVAAERGGQVLVFDDSLSREVYRYDPASGAMAPVLGWDGKTVQGLALDPTGRLFYVDGAGKTRERKGDGAADPLAPGQAPLQNIIADTVVAATADALYAVYMDPYRQTRSLLRRYQGDTTTLVAGKAEEATPGAGATSLVRPAGFTVEPDGTIIAADDGAIVRRTPGGGAATIMAKGKLKADTNLVAEGLEPTSLRPAAGGGWWVVASPSGLIFSTPSHLNHVAADGTVTYLYTAIGSVADVLGLPDGRAWVAEYTNQILATPRVRVSEIGLDRTIKALHDAETRGIGDIAIGRDAAGSLVVGTADGPAPPRVVDGAGRIYRARQEGTVWTIVRGSAIVAGPGGKHFSGTGVDDGLKSALDLQFSANGDLYFLDAPNRQIKRIPAADL